MAGARLEKIGTIFARLNALLKKNVLPMEDKPIWYEIYALHPPHSQPRYDRVPDTKEIREILYEEDIVRAKFHERVRFHETLNFGDHTYESKTTRFIKLYSSLKSQGALDDEKVFEVALEQLNTGGHSKTEVLEDEIIDEPINFGLVSSFTEAQAANKLKEQEQDASSEERNKKPAGSIDIKSLF